MPSETRPPAPGLSVIFPCFNEEARLPASLQRVREYLDGRGVDWEILVVDDGSSDRTVAVAEAAAAADPRVRVLSYGENRGKGRAVAHGMRSARGALVLFTDADLSTPIEELEKLSGQVEAGCQVVIASRALRQSDLRVRQPWWRERLGRLMNRLIRGASGLKFADTQCGFKLFSRRAAEEIFANITIDGWMFDVEVLILAEKLGYRVAEVPVTWINSGDSRVKLTDAPRTLLELARIRSYWLARTPARRTTEEPEIAARSTS
jgi:dolichyl-phosphate beta-glucosyltransferase